MTGHFRGKFSCNIRVITAFVFMTVAGFIMILEFGVSGYAQTPAPTIGGTTIHITTPGPTMAVTPKPLPPPSKYVNQATAILQNGGKIAEDTFNACLINSYMQGLPLKDAIELCSVQLIKDDQTGFGKDLPSEIDVGGDNNQWFSPTHELLSRVQQKPSTFRRRAQ